MSESKFRKRIFQKYRNESRLRTENDANKFRAFGESVVLQRFTCDCEQLKVFIAIKIKLINANYSDSLTYLFLIFNLV